MRVLSAAARRALSGEETGEVFLFLLTITNVGLAQPLRFVNDTADLVSRGHTYLGCPFSITLPEDREDQLGQVVLAIDNIDRSIVAALRAIQQVPSVVLEVVLASSPDTLEAGPFRFNLRQATYDSLVVQGTLQYEDILNEPYPKAKFLPSTTGGLFGLAWIGLSLARRIVELYG